MTLTAAPRIRRIRFSLRWLWIALTVTCVLLGLIANSYHFVRTRERWRDELRLRGAYVLGPFDKLEVIKSWYAVHRLVPRRRLEVSLVRQFFGDEPVVLIEPTPDMDAATVSKLRHFFPEAVFIANGRQMLE